jgi:SAM-dependent methyltransferase
MAHTTNLEVTTDRDLGEHLIFLISMPRSGSTLLQHMLASHSSVASTAEPWILLPLVYALRENGLKADYNANIGYIALGEFLQQLPDGGDRYFAAVRSMALELYDSYLTEHDKERFLDKTSRYYLILPELLRIFPKAKYLFLVRNPLAVLASFLDSMVWGDWRRLAEPGIRHDLLHGSRLVLGGIRYFGDEAIVLRYEDLVSDPQTTVKMLCDQLDLVYEPAMLRYGEHGVLPGKLVDPKSIHRHGGPVTDYVDNWRWRFNSAQELQLARAFLSHIGRPLTETMGYPYPELLAAIQAKANAGGIVVPWQTLMKPPAERSSLQNRLIDFAYIWQEKGATKALYRIPVTTWHKALRILRGTSRWMWRFVRESRLLRTTARRIPSLSKGSLPSRKQGASEDYRHLGPNDIQEDLLLGWRDPLVAERQLAAYRPLLEAMHQGDVRRDFAVAAECLRLVDLDDPTVLEIGCGNGYYWEVLSHLYRRSFTYTGLDYSQSMIASAGRDYPEACFLVGDALNIPFRDNSFDIAWSGTILMHMPDYEKAVSETCRIAGRFCVFHSVPLRIAEATVFLSKKAYGVPVAEVLINQAEFENLLHRHGLVVRHILESLPYSAGDLVYDVETLTYVCEMKTSGA